MSKLINYSSSDDENSDIEQQRKIKMEIKNDKMNSSDHEKTFAVSTIATTLSYNNNNKNDSKEYSRESRDDYRDYKDKKYSKESSSSHKNYSKDRDRVRAREDKNKDRKQKSNYERRNDDRSREYSSRDKHRNDDRSRRTDYRESSNRNRSDRRHNERDKNHQQRSHEKLHKSDYYPKESRRRSKSKEGLNEQKEEQQQIPQNNLFPAKSILPAVPAKISRECPNPGAYNILLSTPEVKQIKPPEIQLPSYYNPNVINPNKFAEQVQKRKLIWGNKKNEDNPAVVNKWAQIGTSFTDDGDGKTASKFMRLMGIKNNPKQNSNINTEIKPNPEGSTNDNVKKREEMFSSMEKQYEVARQVTHTMRGVGFGFNTQRPF